MRILISENNFPKINSAIRCIIFWALFLIFLFGVGTMLSPLFPAKWERFIYGIFGTVSAFLATWVMLKNEHQSFADYGLIWQRTTPIKFFKGIFIGFSIFILIILILITFSDIQLVRSSKLWNPLSAFWYLSILPLALMEEIAFRSYPFLKLNHAFGLRVTQIVIAIAFALYHIIMGWNVRVAFLGPAVWALVFGLAAIWSKGIALPTGIHFALNLMQQLISMRGEDNDAMWILKHNENATADSIALADYVGLLTQLFVSVAAILFTEFFIRKIQKIK